MNTKQITDGDVEARFTALGYNREDLAREIGWSIELINEDFRFPDNPADMLPAKVRLALIRWGVIEPCNDSEREEFEEFETEKQKG